MRPAQMKEPRSWQGNAARKCDWQWTCIAAVDEVNGWLSHWIRAGRK